MRLFKKLALPIFPPFNDIRRSAANVVITDAVAGVITFSLIEPSVVYRAGIDAATGTITITVLEPVVGAEAPIRYRRTLCPQIGRRGVL